MSDDGGAIVPGGGGTTAVDSGSTGTSSGGATADAGGGEEGGAGAEGGVTGEAVGFLGETTPWATSLPGTGATQSMAAGTVVVPTATTDCLNSGCHLGGATGAGASPFLAAGFVATTAGGTTGAADVEVRVYANGTAGTGGYSAHTDSNGYFWINPPIAPGAAGPYNAGVRAGPTGTTPLMMPAPQGTATSTSLDCQSASCHGGTTVGNIHI